MRTPVAALLLAFLPTLPLHAAVVEHDFLASGDGLLTYDDVNRREWLDLTFTPGVNLATISNLMAHDGILADFEFATLVDVRQLANSAGIEWQVSDERAISPEVVELTKLLGVVLLFEIVENRFANHTTVSSFSMSYGQVATQSSLEGSSNNLFDDTNVFLAFFDSPASDIISIANSENFEIITTTLPFDGLPTATGDTGPFWLYRTAVPEPTSIALLTLGAIALLSTRNRCR